MSEMNVLFFQQIVKMFLMLAIGFAAVIYPLLMLGIFLLLRLDTLLPGARQIVLITLLGAALSHGAFIFITRFFGRGRLAFSPVERASMIYSNSGNLLMPLVASAMGQEWLFYTCAYMGALQIFVWTHGESLICGAPCVNFKKALGNLNVLAMAAGFVLFCANIRFTGVAGEAVETLGNALGSTSMLSIGISFATITRLVYPLLMLGIFLLLRLDTLLPGARQIVLITLLGAGAPTGVVVTQIAQLYDRDADEASLIGVVTMACSLFTLPALIWVYEAVTALIR